MAAQPQPALQQQRSRKAPQAAEHIQDPAGRQQQTSRNTRVWQDGAQKASRNAAFGLCAWQKTSRNAVFCDGASQKTSQNAAFGEPALQKTSRFATNLRARARSACAAGRADQASPAAEAYTQAAAARLVHRGRSRPQQETPRSARV